MRKPGAFKNTQQKRRRNTMKYIYIALTICLFCLSQAFAAIDRTFVSTTGADSAGCGAFTSPCRTFASALANTNPAGQVTALDSGLYDSSNIAITFSVTLTAAPGVHAETQ